MCICMCREYRTMMIATLFFRRSKKWIVFCLFIPCLECPNIATAAQSLLKWEQLKAVKTNRIGCALCISHTLFIQSFTDRPIDRSIDRMVVMIKKYDRWIVKMCSNHRKLNQLGHCYLNLIGTSIFIFTNTNTHTHCHLCESNFNENCAYVARLLQFGMDCGAFTLHVLFSLSL